MSCRDVKFLPRFKSFLTFALALAMTPCSTVSAGTFEVASSGEISVVRSQAVAAQFLTHATFGPDMDSINALALRIRQTGALSACEEWMDEQFAMPETFQQPTIDQMLADHGFTNTEERIWAPQYRYFAFWHNAIDAPDQLRQRTAWALSQIFVTNDEDSNFGDLTKDSRGFPHWYGPTNYYDMLVRNSFGNYRQLLGDVTLHPVMGTFLSHLRNAKADPAAGVFPDENYAREVMQLFSIGLYELESDGREKRTPSGDLIPTYDNDVIREMAKVFTGLTFPGSQFFGYGDSRDYQRPMVMWEDYHDTGQKQILAGRILPAHDGSPGKGMQDIHATLDQIANHPNVGPFIARRLIQRFVHSNPSRAYLHRVSAAFEGRDNGGQRGDMQATLKAVLLDPEAFRGVRGIRESNPLRYTVTDRGTEYGKMREPVLRYTAIIRALRSGEVTYDGRPSRWYAIPQMRWQFGQAPFASPSVFNFFLPDYQPPGPLAQVAGSRRLPNTTLYAPEFQVLTPVLINRAANHLRWEIYEGQIRNDVAYLNDRAFTTLIKFDYQRDLELLVNDPKGMMDRLDLLFCNGAMDQASKEKIPAVIAEVYTEMPWVDEKERFMGALFSVISSPSCVITH